MAKNGEDPERNNIDKRTKSTNIQTENIEKDVKKNKKFNVSWAIKTVVLTFFIAAGLSFVSESVLNNVNFIIALIILLIFIFINILFDVIGVAVATADEKPFHSMAARKVYGGKTAIWIIGKAPIVSNFCNDIIGDITGIISGSMGIAISAAIIKVSGFNDLLTGIIVMSVIASITIGGKALCKEIAMKYSNDIVFFISKIIAIVHSEKNNVKNNSKKS